jgi:hypothetical protein
MRTDEGGYCRHHIQALAQRVDVGEAEIRITGSKLTVLRTLVASGGVVKSATNDVRSFLPKWLAFLDTYRTLCLAPTAEIRAIFEQLRDEHQCEPLASNAVRCPHP